MLREEFDLEISNIKHTHKFVDLPVIRIGTLASTHNKERNTEQAVCLEMLEDLEKDMLAKFAQLTGRFQSEKVWRCDAQRKLQMEHKKTEDMVRVLSDGNNMSSHFGQMCLNIVEDKMDVMIEILSEIKEQNGKSDTCIHPAVDCADLYRRGHVTSGVYKVFELEDFENDRRYAKYALFEMAPFSEQFKLTIEDFSGNVTDSLTGTHNNRPFSTFDKGPSAGCAKSYKGGFWYNNCHAVNINGLYLKGEHKSFADGVNWKGLWGYHYSLKFTEKKFRLLEMNFIEYK